MRRFVFLCLAVCYLLAAAAEMSQAQDLPRLAPAHAPAVSMSNGFVPPEVDLTHVQLPAPDAAKTRDLPVHHDWRLQGVMSPVKNQGGCGSCYAFAAASDLESRILRDFADLADISENQLKECHWEGRSCLGGNAQMVMNLLTMQGASLESCDPYVAADVPCNTGCDPHYAVLDWVWLAGSTQPATAALKQALLDHGPLSTTVFAGDGGTPAWQAAFNNWSGGDGLYYAGGETPNHAVVLVGWDDLHPHAGGGQGCWIVKNSWGEAWGDACDHGVTGGYFYLAFGSAGLGKWTSAITEIMPAYPELTVQAWDEGGWTGAFGYQNVQAWGLARFAPAATTYLHNVEFWTTDATTRVDVYVYSSFDGASLSGLLTSVLNQSFSHSGYHSVALPDPLPMTAGTDYYVAVRLQNASYGYPLAIDHQGNHSAGRTWISYNASNWIDLGGTQGCEAGIRIRTSPHSILAVTDPGTPPPAPEPDLGGRFDLEPAWPNPFNPATSLAFSLDRRGLVHLRVYDLQGRLVRTLVADELPAGRHQVRWSGRDEAGRHVPAGIYLGRLDDGLRSRSQRLVLLK